MRTVILEQVGVIECGIFDNGNGFDGPKPNMLEWFNKLYTNEIAEYECCLRIYKDDYVVVNGDKYKVVDSYINFDKMTQFVEINKEVFTNNIDEARKEASKQLRALIDEYDYYKHRKNVNDSKLKYNVKDKEGIIEKIIGYLFKT